MVDNYPKYLEEDLDIFEPLFAKAYDVSEFNLIMSLLAFRGSSDAGWDPFENTLAIFEKVYSEQKNLDSTLRINLNLWLYVHLIECSEHYELIANLLKTVNGEDYIVANHKNKNFINLKVEQKINRLEIIGKDSSFKNVSKPFSSTFNARLRNAIGHADYAIKGGKDGGITIIDDSGFPLMINNQEVNDFVNRAMALHVSIRTLRDSYIGHYKRPVQIKSSPTFGHGKSIDVTLIVRKNHGVIGIRCIGGYDLGKPFEARLVNCFEDERERIEQGINLLPSRE